MSAFLVARPIGAFVLLDDGSPWSIDPDRPVEPGLLEIQNRF